AAALVVSLAITPAAHAAHWHGGYYHHGSSGNAGAAIVGGLIGLGLGAPPAAASSPMAGHAVLGKNAEERVEHRIDELHAQLRITPAEQQQWNQFAEVMRDNARDMDKAFMQRAEQFQSMNALQNMESYEQIAEAHAQHLQTLVPAFQNLYSAMPDQQK